ncbi:alpha-L-rhamnosidase C-terminal domain-containing protein [Lederbergia galactosidilytica]|uniref:alpha-L-rhamnosidase C-terminal domain-containing protein n=1 Tax=Lederbergia galactosidilytica TaxID=217031 RepID=UPI001AE532C1|nr:alpha-L-rhamnosidase C-terminal domain-containing protein [Lederbergia galactosidilytica]
MGKIPSWVWHEDGMKQKEIIIKKTFHLLNKVGNVSFKMALTGTASVFLDGILIETLKEHPRLVTRFEEITNFPNHLKAGQHELKIEIKCETPMPVAPISIHLSNRLLGMIGYLEGDDLWIPTDTTWMTENRQVTEICVYGEEPFGDLENSPPSFIRGGFEDIVTKSIKEITILKENLLESKWQDQLEIYGDLGETFPLSEFEEKDRFIFYHVRKQTEWREKRKWQRSLDLRGIPSIRIDLQKEYNARFIVKNKGAIPLTILWNGSESIDELEHYDGCMTDWLEIEPNCQASILPQGMRYLDFFIYGQPNCKFHAEIGFEEAYAELEQVGRFTSDLPLLNNIYDVAVHTNRICHQLGLWDGIKRDRLNWVYDYYMAAKADYVLWDDFKVLKRSIVELGHGTPYGYWMNSIPSYTLWWFNNVWEYYLHTEDKEFILAMKEDIQKHLQWVTDNIESDTGFFKEKHAPFLEWVPMEEEEYWNAFHALLMITKKNLNQLIAYVPELGSPVKWQEPNLKEEDFLVNSQALIIPLMGILSGVVSDTKAIEFLKTYKPTNPISPLSAFWMAECCSKFGLQEHAWNVLQIVWGYMLEKDSTTFWESSILTGKRDFHHNQTTYTAYDSYRMSLCHSWSSTPVQWISRYILGIKPMKPGFREVVFKPLPLAELRYCSGSISTPFGAIYVQVNKEKNGELATKVIAPPEVRII